MQETDLVDGAVAWLNGSLPSGWTAERSTWQIVGPNGPEPTVIDPVINLRGSNASATFVVEARSSVSPRDVERLMAGLSRMLRTVARVSVLVVAPWLSARTQEVLRAEEINYVDLTGNAWIRSEQPAVFISSVGATRNPEPAQRETARLRGAKAGRLVRALVDIRPPYGVRSLAQATDLNPGYVSRLLEALDREALVDRTNRGEVIAVDYQALLLRWTETYQVFRSNEMSRYIAPEGTAQALSQLSSLTIRDPFAVTGSFAAVRRAPIAAPALLAAYAEEPSTLAGALKLLPADEGANVVLLRPFDSAVWDRLELDEGISYVAPSQVAADCLTGTGRMPAEGQALLAWMSANEALWRVPSLTALTEPDQSP
jgi:hypothetical protein